MFKPVSLALLLVLACNIPYAAPFSLAPALQGLPRLRGVSSQARGAPLPVRTSAPAWGAAPARRNCGPALYMVNTELLQTLDEGELSKLKVADLKEICESCGLVKSGKKADLISRILELQAKTATTGGATMPVADEDGMADSGDMMEMEEFQEPQEVYAMSNPAPARLFDGSGTAIAREELPELTGSTRRLVTQPRTGNCWHGIFFDIHAKTKPVTVTAIRTASSPEGAAPVREDYMDLSVYTCDGRSKPLKH
jgi:hypothetical protein